MACLRVYVLACSRAWRACVLTYLACLRAYLLTCLACLRVYVLGVFTCLRAWRAYVLRCLRAWCACIFTCMLVMMKYFIFLRVYLLGVLYISILKFKNSHNKKIVCFVNQPQKRILHYKENRSAKCYGRRCDVVFTKGSLCLKVTGALTIPLGKKEAVEQLFYFCGKKNCLLQKPVWCNVQYPTCIEASKTVVEQDIRRVADEFELPIVNEIWKRFNQID